MRLFYKSLCKPMGLMAFIWTALLLSMDTALGAEAKPKLDSGDTAWMLTSTALVLLMTIPGVAFFYGGMVRKKTYSLPLCKALPLHV